MINVFRADFSHRGLQRCDWFLVHLAESQRAGAAGAFDESNFVA